ncbi:hypothetical protein [Fibrella forsythiae]|uniref:Uncharacterized protein n=1 Tax=Fibrella forsythiae TaxID=2817061 RepID=A0ABS3JAI0_9BACT|nr:hypothetical protein [Fibrella forsythiae]MBO0947002.1 hypothetical protein [Fibrella forsythiae]
MNEQNFTLQNYTTGQFHQIRGISPEGSPVALTQKPYGMGLYHKTLSEAMAFATSGDTVILLRNVTEYITLKNGVNINGNGYSITSAANAPLMTDGGNQVICEVFNFERLQNLYNGGISEWNGLIMVTGGGSDITVQGKTLFTPPGNGFTWNGKAAICNGINATLRLRFKNIVANAVEVGGTGARIFIEDGSYSSPNATSYAYRVTTGEKGSVIFNNMAITVKNQLTYDLDCLATYNRCRIKSERNGLNDRARSRYTFIDCQFVGQTKATWQAETDSIHTMSATGILELLGTNTFIAKGAAAAWLTPAAGSAVSINGKLISNKPSPASNFAPTVGTAANGSILIDAAADLKFLQ